MTIHIYWALGFGALASAITYAYGYYRGVTNERLFRECRPSGGPVR